MTRTQMKKRVKQIFGGKCEGGCGQTAGLDFYEVHLGALVEYRQFLEDALDTDRPLPGVALLCKNCDGAVERVPDDQCRRLCCAGRRAGSRSLRDHA